MEEIYGAQNLTGYVYKLHSVLKHQQISVTFTYILLPNPIETLILLVYCFLGGYVTFKNYLSS